MVGGAILFPMATIQEIEERMKTRTPSSSIEAFAQTVRDVAAQAPTGYYGLDKVFISHVWQHGNACGLLHGMNLQEFKQRLLEANQANCLTLSQADLPDRLSRVDVVESSTPYLNAMFHFVRISWTEWRQV